MTPCPTCHQPVELQDKHWGTLFTCPQCSAVFFVDWNGQPETVQHETLEEAVESGSEYGINQEFTTHNESISPDASSDFYPIPGETDASSYTTEGSIEGSQDEVSFAEEPLLDVIPDLHLEAPQVINPDPDLHSFEKPLDRQMSDAYEMKASSDNSDLSDIADYANSDQHAGPVTYEVRIQGIDSSHLALELKEAMSDSRFAWDVGALITSIESGTLILPGLSPAKASVLINRIKYLPFKISWRQDVLTSS